MTDGGEARKFQWNCVSPDPLSSFPDNGGIRLQSELTWGCILPQGRSSGGFGKDDSDPCWPDGGSKDRNILFLHYPSEPLLDYFQARVAAYHMGS